MSSYDPERTSGWIKSRMVAVPYRRMKEPYLPTHTEAAGGDDRRPWHLFCFAWDYGMLNLGRQSEDEAAPQSASFPGMCRSR
jgi:hypothetical protein